MENSIKVRCPVCGTPLAVKWSRIEPTSVICPVCKNKSLLKDCQKIWNPAAEEHTQYPGSGGSDDATQYPGENSPNPTDGLGGNFAGNNSPYPKAPKPEMNLTLGVIRVPSTSLSFQLKPGRNIIGRKAERSSAHIQIPCESRRMSREHLVIEVKKVPGKGFVHYVSLYKEQVNKTFIGDNLLEYGDTIVLNHNDIIKLPNLEIRFEIPDDEGTEI